MATLQNIGKLKYRGKDGQWHPLPVVVQGASGGVSTISGKGAPTSETQGKVNQLYRDELTDKLYICTGVKGGYTWAAVVSDTEDAVTYTAQTLTEGQKTQARSNIGAGTSNFSGSYNDLSNKPNIPAASVIDTTLTKSGQAADAKAAGDAIEKKLDKAQGVENAGKILGIGNDGNVVPEDKPVQELAGATAPTTATAGVVGQEYYVIVNNAVTEMYVCTSALIGSYTWDKVEFGGGTSNAVQYTEQSLTDTQKQQARTNIGAGTSSFSGSYNDLTNTPIPDTTLKQSGKPADAKAVGEALDGVSDVVTTFDSIKVDKSQGTANAGKYLGVGNDGNVTVVDAPSSGGTDKSLGITSATVGQIAKITAVDAAGKPTGWEPVDMPSGVEGGMRLIKSITIGEEGVNSIYFDADDDGNPFALTKEITIRMYGGTKNTGGTTTTLFFRGGDGTIGNSLQSSYPVKVNGQSSNYIFGFIFELRAIGNMWYGDFAHSKDAAAHMYMYVPAGTIATEKMAIKEIKLEWNMADLFYPVGSKIQIYGR